MYSNFVRGNLVIYSLEEVTDVNVHSIYLILCMHWSNLERER